MSDLTSLSPGINQALLEKYFAEGNLKQLKSLFDHLWKCKERAESLSQAYLNQMIVLEKEKKREGTSSISSEQSVIPSSRSSPTKQTKSQGSSLVSLPILDLDELE